MPTCRSHNDIFMSTDLFTSFYPLSFFLKKKTMTTIEYQKYLVVCDNKDISEEGTKRARALSRHVLRTRQNDCLNVHGKLFTYSSPTIIVFHFKHPNEEETDIILTYMYKSYYNTFIIYRSRRPINTGRRHGTLRLRGKLHSSIGYLRITLLPPVSVILTVVCVFVLHLF